MKEFSCMFPLLLCLLVLQFQTGAFQDSDAVEGRAIRFHDVDRPCRYRRQQGTCQRRSDCKKPTRHICRFGANPVVCCLDQPELKTTTIIATTKRPTTTKKSLIRPDSIKAIDLTFPGCGSRIPRVQEPNSNSRGSGNNRRGLFSGIGKRSTLQRALRRKRARPGVPVIVGGTTADAHSWPWMVAIFKEITPRVPKRFLCGASLISRKYVLSAAHCFDGEKGNIDVSKYFIVTGAHSTKDGTEYRVQNILLHPDYKPRQYYNDMSLLKVEKDVTLTKKVFPVCLPSDGLKNKINPSNNNVTVTGWGDTSFGGVSSKVLQELTIPIVPLKECNESYSKLALNNFPFGITKLFVCAGVKDGGKDACQGDSGGPLVTKLKDNSYAQLGIVSFGYGCAQPGFPGVYTRVSQFTKWLYDNTDLGK